MKQAPWIRMTEREFRSLKRYWFLQLKRAEKEFNFGSMYLPVGGYKEWSELRDCIARVDAICKPWWKKA